MRVYTLRLMLFLIGDQSDSFRIDNFWVGLIKYHIFNIQYNLSKFRPRSTLIDDTWCGLLLNVVVRFIPSLVARVPFATSHVLPELLLRHLMCLLVAGLSDTSMDRFTAELARRSSIQDSFNRVKIDSSSCQSAQIFSILYIDCSPADLPISLQGQAYTLLTSVSRLDNR